MNKNCAFQYALGNPGLQKAIIEDTDLITFDEAKALWEKYIPSFKSNLQNGYKPEMAIWVDMENNIDYHTSKYHLDSRDNLEFIGDRVYRSVKEEVEMP